MSTPVEILYGAGSTLSVFVTFPGWYAVGEWFSLAGTTREAFAFVPVSVTVVALALLENRYATGPPTDPTT